MRFNKRKLKSQYLIVYKNTKKHCPNMVYIRFFTWFSSILCVNTLEGSNNTIFRLGILDIAFSITGRTSFHSSPPFPQPRGGIEIEVICFSLITRTRSVNPSWIYLICEGFFQCALVGKSITYCGLSNKPDSVTNIFPVTTSPASHAFLYCLYFSGKRSLNWRAIPFPITPFLFTVLTTASVSSVSISPFLYSTIIKSTNLF